MENYQGDLADIVRASVSDVTASLIDTQIPISQIGCYPENLFHDDFGDPFNQLADPLRIDTTPPPVSGFALNLDTMKSSSSRNGGFDAFDGSYRNPGVNLADHMIVDHDEITKRPSDLFARMLQISSNQNSPPAAASSSSMLLSNYDDQVLTFPYSSKLGCLMENPGSQISPPQNTGIKRRKSQAKKVVCIPAPAPANTRHSGEVVPSDLWAWRKYGQKPIKGSPFPRGYYRCSSSKGCPARKQVERSRTDPSMLVITYTSEHNHPWPTQRNALAGSTRSHPIKTNPAAGKSPNPASPDEEKREISAENNAAGVGNRVILKEEKDQDFVSQLELNITDEHYEDFFVDLGEMEPDPLDLLFTQGSSGDENKTLDQYSFYDWPADHNYPAAAATGAQPYHREPGP